MLLVGRCLVKVPTPELRQTNGGLAAGDCFTTVLRTTNGKLRGFRRKDSASDRLARGDPAESRIIGRRLTPELLGREVDFMGFCTCRCAIQPRLARWFSTRLQKKCSFPDFPRWVQRRRIPGLALLRIPHGGLATPESLAMVYAVNEQRIFALPARSRPSGAISDHPLVACPAGDGPDGCRSAAGA